MRTKDSLHHQSDARRPRRLSYNGLGVIGFIIGTTAGQHNIAAGIGNYGAAVWIYERWIKPGREVTFARDTRLVLQTGPRHSMFLDPNPIAASLLNHCMLSAH